MKNVHLASIVMCAAILGGTVGVGTLVLGVIIGRPGLAVLGAVCAVLNGLMFTIVWKI